MSCLTGNFSSRQVDKLNLKNGRKNSVSYTVEEKLKDWNLKQKSGKKVQVCAVFFPRRLIHVFSLKLTCPVKFSLRNILMSVIFYKRQNYLQFLANIRWKKTQNLERKTASRIYIFLNFPPYGFRSIGSWRNTSYFGWRRDVFGKSDLENYSFFYIGLHNY